MDYSLLILKVNWEKEIENLNLAKDYPFKIFSSKLRIA